MGVVEKIDEILKSCGMFLLIGAVFLFVVMIYFAHQQSYQVNYFVSLVVSIMQLMLFLPAFIVMRRRYLWLRTYPEEFISIDRIKWGNIVVALTVLAACLLVIFGMTERSDRPFPEMTEMLGVVLYQFIFIALAEEVIFRGFTFSLFNNKRWLAVFVSSFLFSLYHINNGIYVLPYYLSMGIILGVLRYYELSIVNLIMWHASFNVIVDIFWGVGGFRFGAVAFYIVSTFSFLFFAASAGWLLSTFAFREKEERLDVR